ncbi:DUF2339 domain-containing protein [uncultured Kordia sp.]|uniref:DUF2339 domain-containing protein n=1 Tax=uncultured Kordia sp. TaxID=507699 RepID=UPI00262BBE92|nr:DUF2339 domain-containing protein [uncultured Kordia sp.]
MQDHSETIRQLTRKLELLSQKQQQFSREINDLRFQIENLKLARWDAIVKTQEAKEEKKASNIISEVVFETTKNEIKETVSTPKVVSEKSTPAFIPKPNKIEEVLDQKSNLEKFIGENLLNKIGIIITIIGVAIGVKYSIEHELITPTTRIILGYLSGIGLLGFGIKLKKKYENYSAVLVSGAIAVLYFITYAAFSFYNLIPQMLAFILMVIFTVSGVYAAIKYNRQVIAHIGLVGAYGVPFLVSTDSGNVLVLFTYMTIINIGILTISFKKYWKSLLGSAFGITWLIYLSWIITEYKIDDHFGIALTFLFVFFAIFYTTILAYKLIKKEVYTGIDIVLLLFNTFITYGIGYSILLEHAIGKQFLGVFTLSIAFVHLIVSYILYTRKDSDKNLLYLVFGLVITFVTIAIPVELDGNWVTILWVFEATLLFWVGRTKGIKIYEKLAHPVMFLAFFSLAHDWGSLYIDSYDYREEKRILPIINMNFLGSLLFMLSFGYSTYLFYKKEYTSPLKLSKTISQFLAIAIPGMLLFAIYYSFRIEIANYWNQLHIDSGFRAGTDKFDGLKNLNYNLLEFKNTWIINYSLLFLTILSYINIKKIQHEILAYVNLVLNVLAIFVFLTQGLFALSELRDAYIQQSTDTTVFAILIRYISYVFVISLLMITRMYVRQEFIKKNLKIIFYGIFHITILCILSSELIHWLDIASNAASDKLGLSILWGTYALFVIVLGIWKRNKYLRIGAIALFGITLVKLFLYDIAHLTTIAKTIVFVSLGVLLLIISFLYNKYKNKIFEEVSNEA